MDLKTHSSTFAGVCASTGCGGRQLAAVGIGIGGLFFPRGLGVGYDNIAELLRGNAAAGAAGWAW